MNINDFKEYLQHIHGTLDDDPGNKQLRENSKVKRGKPIPMRLGRGVPVGRGTRDAERRQHETKVAKERLRQREWGDSVEYDEQDVLEYFESYFGGNFNEDTSDDDIMNAVYDLVELCDTVTEIAGHIPDDPDVVKWWGGKDKVDALNARLSNRRKIDKKIPKVKVTRKAVKKKKDRRQLELFAANQYFENYFGQELNEDISVDYRSCSGYLCYIRYCLCYSNVKNSLKFTIYPFVEYI